MSMQQNKIYISTRGLLPCDSGYIRLRQQWRVHKSLQTPWIQTHEPAPRYDTVADEFGIFNTQILARRSLSR